MTIHEAIEDLASKWQAKGGAVGEWTGAIRPQDAAAELRALLAAHPPEHQVITDAGYLSPEAVEQRVREAEARALREAAGAIESDPGLRLGHNISVVCSCLRCEVAKGAARLTRDRADRIERSEP